MELLRFYSAKDLRAVAKACGCFVSHIAAAAVAVAAATGAFVVDLLRLMHRDISRHIKTNRRLVICASVHICFAGMC